MTSSTPIIETKVGRARRGFGQLWQVPAFVVGLLTLLGAAISAPWRHTPDWWAFQELIVQMRRGLEKNEPGDELVVHAEDARSRLWQFPERAAETHFLIGSAYYRQAQQKPAELSQVVWPHAVEEFEQALLLPLAAKDRPAVQYRLGHSLYQLGTDMPRALELMTQAVDKGAEQPLQGYLLLVQANLKLTPPNLDAALAASRRILDLTPEGNADALTQARILHADLLVRKDQRIEAISELDKIGPKAPRLLRVKARLLQARACEEEGQLSRAVALWQELLKDAGLVKGGKGRIYYAMGWCYHNMEPPKIADTIKVWSEALRQGGDAGQAAGLRLGEMRLSLGDKEARQALDHWKQAMRDVNSPAEFQNPYIELDVAKELFEHALKQFQDKQDTQKAEEVAKLLGKIAPGGSADLKLAEALYARARQLQKQKDAPASIVAKQFLSAAEAFERAAKVHPEAERPNVLWRSIQCYLSAKETKRSDDLLQQYVKLDVGEERLGEAWFTLGDLYRALDNKVSARAHQAFFKGLEYDKSSFANKTRYWLAVEEIDKKNYDRARDILNDILSRLSATELDRACHEKSLYKMASLLMLMKNYDEARLMLSDCVRVYGENPNAILAREQLGECYRCLAKKELAKEEDLRKQGPFADPDRQRRLDEEIRHHHGLRVNHLADAIKTYQALLEELRTRASERPRLSPIELILLRRGMFGLGESHFDRGEYGEGLRIFQKLQEDHRKTLEGFYAGLRICNLAEVIREPRQQAKLYQELAAKSLRLILEDVQAMPKDHDVFRTPGVSSREDWLRWAEMMEKKLAAPVKQERPAGLFP